MEPENFDLDVFQTNEIQLNKCPADENISNNTEDKSQVFQGETRCIVKENILQSLRRIYAGLLFTVAVVALFIEVLHGPIQLFRIHVYFYFYLLGVSILIFVGSIGRTLIHKLNGKRLNQECEAGIWQRNNNYLNLTICFMFGLVACGLAGIIFTSLGLATVLTSRTCLSTTSSALYYLQFIFIFCQLMFLILNGKRLIDVFGCFHKMSIMHLAATNAALWLYMVLFESARDWQGALHDGHNSSVTWSHKDLNISLHSLESDINSPDQENHFPKHVVRLTSNCWWRVAAGLEQYEDIISLHLCLQNSTVGNIWKKALDYLYPTMVQHYLIVLFLLYITWKSMTLRCKIQCSLVQVESQRSRYCFWSSILLLCVFLIASIVIVTLCLVLDIPNFEVVVLSMFMIIFASSICAVLYGLFHMKPLETSIGFQNQNYLNFYQNFGMYVVYAYGVCNLFAGCLSREKYSLFLIIEALLMIFHAISQHIFIQCQMVRKSKLVVIFLVICNSSLWVLESFIFGSKAPTGIQQKIFGVIAWPVMNRIIIPCLAFYRFHCVIVLLDDLKF